MQIKRTIAPGVELTFTLSKDELEDAYREQQYAYQLQDAEENLVEYLGLNADTHSDEELHENSEQLKHRTGGITFDDLLDFNGPHFILNEIIAEFNENFSAESSEAYAWCFAIEGVFNGKGWN